MVSITANERLALINVKVERAKKHIADLNREIISFFNSDPYKVGTKHDPQTRKLVYYITSVQPLWQINELNIIDKHRLLITVASIFRSVDIVSVIAPELIKAGFDKEGVNLLECFLMSGVSPTA